MFAGGMDAPVGGSTSRQSTSSQTTYGFTRVSFVPFIFEKEYFTFFGS
jgi:hypothetical protein